MGTLLVFISDQQSRQILSTKQFCANKQCHYKGFTWGRIHQILSVLTALWIPAGRCCMQSLYNPLCLTAIMLPDKPSLLPIQKTPEGLHLCDTQTSSTHNSLTLQEPASSAPPAHSDAFLCSGPEEPLPCAEALQQFFYSTAYGKRGKSQPDITAAVAEMR